MQPSDPNKPDKIPDMTLPDRTSPALPRVPDMAMPERIDVPASLPHGGEVKLPAKAPAPWEKAKEHHSGWKVGDRVLAPWEPAFLYVGTIQEFKTAKALIQFDDGDAGWVFVDQIEKLAVKVGQKVLSRRNMGSAFFPAEILEVRGEKVLIGFDDGSENEWTKIAALRIVRDEEGDGAEPTKVEANRDFAAEIHNGDRVWAPWVVEAFFVGTVDRIQGEEALIHFDDGDQGWVRLDQLLPFIAAADMRVLGRWKMGSQFFPGTIDHVVGDKIHIVYDDGDQEWTRAAALALPRDPVGPAARPTRTASQGSGARSWLLWGAFFVVVTLLRIGCRAANM